MTELGLFAIVSAMLGMSMFSSEDEDSPEEELQETEIEPEIELQPSPEEEPQEPEIESQPAPEEQPEEDGEPLDLGATFLRTGTGVTLEVGEDETRSLAVIYYRDTEDAGYDLVTEVDEARFYLVPEDVDWSGVNWETQQDAPGTEESDDLYRFYLGNVDAEYGSSFEAEYGLELLGVVDLLGVPGESYQDRIGEIEANAPVSGYYLEANTDGDDLVSFLPEDYVVTRNGVAQTTVEEDTIGSDEDDWLSSISTATGITLDGAAGDDIIVSTGEGTTLIGGEGNDTLEVQFHATDNTIIAGPGDDVALSNVTDSGLTVDLGSGDDTADVSGGTVNGGEGADVIFGSSYGFTPVREDGATVVLFGGEGDDELRVSGDGPDDQAFGGAGNDTVSAYGGAIANGGAGDDLVRVGPGSQAFGGDGDDFISVYNGVYEENGHATLTGGAGQDTFEASIQNFRGEDEGVFALVTDFDPDEDVLVVNQRDGNAQNNALENVTLIPAEDGSFIDVQLEYRNRIIGDLGIAIIRLEGITDFTLDQVNILT